ncbi:hypothetical protein ACQP3J_26450 [Escherichia coli]
MSQLEDAVLGATAASSSLSSVLCISCVLPANYTDVKGTSEDMLNSVPPFIKAFAEVASLGNRWVNHEGKRQL